MKTFYIIENNKQVGPFNLDELAKKKISKTTKVWHEGMDAWGDANSVEELQVLFSKLPPPIPKVLVEEKKRKVFGISRTNFIALSVGLSVVFIFFIVNGIIENKREYQSEIQKQDDVIKAQKRDLLRQQNYIEEKREKELKAAADAKLKKEIQSLVGLRSENIIALNKAKAKLESVKDFQFLRTSKEKESQIIKAQERIDYIANQISYIEKEIKKLDPNWLPSNR